MKPRDLQDAADKFREFNDFDVRSTGPFAPDFELPREIGVAGEAVHVSYASDKWGDGMQHYIHHHDCKCIHSIEDHEDDGTEACKKCKCRGFRSNVHVFMPGKRPERTQVPGYILRARTLTRLGRCLDFCYFSASGVEQVEKPGKGCELYCIPSGKALVVVRDKRVVVAMIWGGRLGVIDDGIIG